MGDQVGPQKLWSEIKRQAPQYAKVLPQLPVLLHQYLQQSPQDALQRDVLARLLSQQERTYSFLQAVVYGLGGFVLGVLLTLALAKGYFWH
jgi:ubiquinone biosynthesis protein